jgi:hypothetical protein
LVKNKIADNKSMNYKLSTNVSYQSVGEDIVVLDFATGRYYNLHDLAVSLFHFYVAGGSSEDAINLVSRHFNRVVEDIKQDLTIFTDTLIGQKILVKTDLGDPSAELPIRTASYKMPSVEVFDDLSDQLLLDDYVESDQPAKWKT